MCTLHELRQFIKPLAESAGDPGDARGSSVCWREEEASRARYEPFSSGISARPSIVPKTCPLITGERTRCSVYRGTDPRVYRTSLSMALRDLPRFLEAENFGRKASRGPPSATARAANRACTHIADHNAFFLLKRHRNRRTRFPFAQRLPFTEKPRAQVELILTTQWGNKNIGTVTFLQSVTEAVFIFFFFFFLLFCYFMVLNALHRHIIADEVCRH